MQAYRTHLSGKDKLALFSDLSTMLTAGIPIMEVIESLRHDARGNLKTVLTEMHRSLTNGESLSHSMERFPNAFDPVTINIMRAAEVGGTLDETLKDIVRNTKKEVAFSDNLRVAMIYPAFIGVIFTGIILLMLTFVIPRISQVFSAMHVAMPLPTRIMIATSDFFMSHWIGVSAGAVVLLVGLTLLVMSTRATLIRLLLSVPGLRRLGLNIDLARLTRSFALLLRSGVPLDEALLLSRRVVSRPQVVEVITYMQQNIDGGKSLAQGLSGLRSTIPPIMARSIETAETAGTLEQTLQNLADYFEEQVGESLKVVSSMIEPVMIVLIGMMVGGLMIMVIAPIYNLISQVSAH